MAKACTSDDELIWRRRLGKRQAGVRFVKASPDYAACCLRPPTPDPFDRTVTKRRWERSMQDFRRAIRDQAPQNAPEWLEAQGSEITPAISPIDVESTDESPTDLAFLCGCWEDQRGSVYTLSPGRAGAFHVETTRPNGQQRYTRDLVRSALVRGRQATIWGRCRYELECRGSNTLLWRGLSEHDVFLWHRVS